MDMRFGAGGNKEWDIRWEAAGDLCILSQTRRDDGHDMERILQRLLVELRYMTHEVEENKPERDMEDNPYTVHPMEPARDDDFEDSDDDRREYWPWRQQDQTCSCHRQKQR